VTAKEWRVADRQQKPSLLSRCFVGARRDAAPWLLVALLLAAGGCKKAPVQPLSSEAYVWQSADKPAVREAMAQSKEIVSQIHVRAAEMRWNGETFVTQWFVKLLPVEGCGLVIRIGSSASRLEWTPGQIAEVAAVFKKVAEFSPSEIQCDFDCPQKRLAGYEILLHGLQEAVGKIPVIPTALPSWLDEEAFAKLIEGRAGYVLQVHSLQLPSKPDEAPVIFDSGKARAAAFKAAKLGVPFRIAMATYGCEVRFDKDGKVLDVVSEDFAEVTPNVQKRAFALADPVTSARLVRKWEDNRPDGLTGIIWYRLPVEGDMRNWPWRTFQLVARGEVSKSAPVVEASPGPGARDISVVNHGEFPVQLPRIISVRSAVTVADGGGAYIVEKSGDGVKFLLRDDVWPWLDPGKKIASGWLRLREGDEQIDWIVTP